MLDAVVNQQHVVSLAAQSLNGILEAPVVPLQLTQHAQKG